MARGEWTRGRTCDVVDVRVDDDVEALCSIVLGNICGGELLRHGDGDVMVMVGRYEAIWRKGLLVRYIAGMKRWQSIYKKRARLTPTAALPQVRRRR